MSRLPVRIRLTAAFAAAMLAMLTGAALFVYARLYQDLDDGVDAQLRARADAVVAHLPAARLDGISLEDPEESFVQLLSPQGRLLDSVGGARAAGLPATALPRAGDRPVVVERQLAGVDGPVRVLGRLAQGAGAPVVVVVGQSLTDRDDALAGVVTSFTVGGAMAVVVASVTGYVLARSGLAPVEAMRRRALEVSLTRADEGLPLPAARDEVRRLGETLNDMLNRLRESFQREGRFVADASHELRTPVAVIKTELDGALRTGDYGPTVHEALVAAVDECDRLAHLAEDLLVLARAADGGLPVRRDDVPMGALLEGVRDRFVDRAAHRDRRIVVDVPDGVHVHADPVRTRQAVGNLVDNALRHGSGEIRLSARSARQVDGKPFRSETTLLPTTMTVDWSGERIETLVSQYAAYLDGRIAEVALDRYAQADDGSVWYLGEDVYDYRDGSVDVTEGTWLAGRDGPPAMIMPAQPNVGDVFRPENVSGIVFEEVRVKAVGQTVDGPRGPVNGAIIADEPHLDGTHAEKVFAPGYGEFSTQTGGDVEAWPSPPPPTWWTAQHRVRSRP